MTDENAVLLGRPAAPVVDRQGRRLIAYRDDGPLAAAFARFTRGQLPPLPGAVAGGMIAGVLLVIGLGAQRGPLLFAPFMAMLLNAPGAGHPHSGRLDWLVPPIIRATEYGFLGALGLSQGVWPPL